MGRPAKNLANNSSHLTKEELAIRQDTENKLKGNTDKLIPNSYLNNRQKEIFNYVLTQLEESKSLGNLDVFVLNQTAICIEKIEEVDKLINQDINKLNSKDFRAIKDMYTKQFFRYCNELCLSPQARAKLSISLGGNKKEKDPLAEILRDDEDD